MRNLLLVFVLITVAVHFGESLQCYDCVNSNNFLCSDPFKKNVAHTFCGNDMVCGKLVMPPPGIPKKNTGNSENSYFRRCVARNFCNGVDEVAIHCSTCSTELCNSAKSITSSISIIVLAGVIKLMLF